MSARNSAGSGAAAPADQVGAVIDQLEQILQSQLSGYGRMRTCLNEKREAIAQADMAEIERICREQQRIAQTVTELEKHRLALIGRLTEAMKPQASEPLSISDVAEQADDERKARLLRVRDDLLALVHTVQRESSVVRQAAESLSRHMTGLIQTVQNTLSQAGVYGQRGRVQDGAVSRHAIDVKS